MADKSPLAQSPICPESEPPVPTSVGRTLLYIAVALALSSGLCWCLRWQAAPPGTGIISGRSLPVVSVGTGRIELLWVNEGDAVQAGDPILILVDEPLLLEIERQKRALEEIQRALDRAEQSLDEQLTKQFDALDAEIIARKTALGFIATGNLAADSRLQVLETQRLNAVHQARANLGIDHIREELLRAEARLQELQSQPKRITLFASATGTIKRILRKPGERIVPGTPVLELADQSQPYLVVEMPEPLAKRFALGDAIPLSFPGQNNAMGRIANMHRLEPEKAYDPAETDAPKAEANVRVEIDPIDESWPEVSFMSKVTVRTADSRAMSRRVH